MPKYRYMLTLFQHAHKSGEQVRKLPGYAWTRLGTSATLNATEILTFEDRDAMISSLRETGLLTPDQLKSADSQFMQTASYDVEVDVPDEALALIEPPRETQPGEVRPSDIYQTKLNTLPK